MVNDLAISLVFTALGNKPKKFNFLHQTVSHREVHVGVGTRLLCSPDFLAGRCTWGGHKTALFTVHFMPTGICWSP